MPVYDPAGTKAPGIPETAPANKLRLRGFFAEWIKLGVAGNKSDYIAGTELFDWLCRLLGKQPEFSFGEIRRSQNCRRSRRVQERITE